LERLVFASTVEPADIETYHPSLFTANDVNVKENTVNAWRKTESNLPGAIAGAWERVARNRYVAHMDMLGMSELTLRDPKLAWAAVSEMPLARQRRVQGLSYTIGGNDLRIADHVAAFTFSDTILLFTKGDEAEDLRSILFACLEMLTLLLSRSVPVRIGVAHGLFVFNLDEGLLVGPPLIQAYRLGEGVITESCGSGAGMKKAAYPSA
jgi:hypothetical protein